MSPAARAGLAAPVAAAAARCGGGARWGRESGAAVAQKAARLGVAAAARVVRWRCQLSVMASAAVA
eukprot:1393489-Pleurochrysis_carterae.AAC.1